MSHFLEKSRENKIAGNFLKDRNKMNAAIHCWYYSCIQKLLHVLNHNFGESIDNISGGMHSYLIKRIRSDLRSRNQHRTAANFDQKMKLLKDLRIEADYTDKMSTLKEAEDALLCTRQLHNLIRRYYDV